MLSLVDSSEEVGTKLTHRSAITNGTVLLPGVDGRSSWVRRTRDLITNHVLDLGGPEAISEAEKSIVRRASVLTVELENLERQFATAGNATAAQLDTYQRTANSLRRLLESVGLQRRTRDVTSLAQYFGPHAVQEPAQESVAPDQPAVRVIIADDADALPGPSLPVPHLTGEAGGVLDGINSSGDPVEPLPESSRGHYPPVQVGVREEGSSFPENRDAEKIDDSAKIAEPAKIGESIVLHDGRCYLRCLAISPPRWSLVRGSDGMILQYFSSHEAAEKRADELIEARKI